MKRYFWVIYLVNIFLFAQNETDQLRTDLYRFVYENAINKRIDSTFLRLNIDSIYNELNQSNIASKAKNELMHLLYRASVIADEYSNLSLSIGKSSLELSEKTKDDINSSYYKAYYKKDANNFNFWIRTINLFSGVDDSYEKGIEDLLTLKNLSPDMEVLLLRDKINICLKVKKDIPAALESLKTLFELTNSKDVLNEYANLNYKNGFYEEYISLKEKMESFNIDDIRNLMRSYIKTANFSNANEILQKIDVDSTDWDLNIQSAHIYFYTLNKSINIDLFEDHNLYYNYLPRDVFNPIEFTQYIYMAELLINQSNNNKTIDYITEHLKDNDLTQDEYHYFRAIIFWKEKDYFNAKRIIHNLLNNNEDLDEKYSHNAHFVLSHIAYLTNDNENFIDYLDQIDRSYLKPEWRHLLAYLELSSR